MPNRFPHHIAVSGIAPSIARTPPDILHLMNGLAACGAQVDCLAPFAPGEGEGYLDPRVRIIRTGADERWAGSAMLPDYLAEARPDVLLTNREWAHQEAVRARHASAAPTQVVFRLGSLVGAQLARRNALQRWRLRRRMRPAYAAADGILALSEAIATDPALTALVAPARIRAVPNTVIPADFRQRAAADIDHPWLPARDVPVFLAVGRLVQVKDYPTLLSAFAILRAQRPCRLLILGDGDQRPQLQAQIARLGLKQDVELLGFQPNPLPYMRQASALVLSSFLEGLGNVLIEAMACGTPVLATDCGGPREVLADGTLGPLVPVGESTALAQAMAAILATPTPAALLKAAAARYEVNFAAEATLRNLAELLTPEYRA